MAETQQYSQDWASRHFTNWSKALEHIRGKPHACALELGSFEGRSALFFLDEVLTHPTSRLICVDLWESRKTQLRFLQNLMCADVFDRCDIIQGDTHETLRSLTKALDFVYVDADHRASAVLTDAVLAWPLLVSGGVLIFDDYQWDRSGKHLPKVGIDAFLEAFQGQYEMLHKGWQVIIQKI